jgi:hypothetical protein
MHTKTEILSMLRDVFNRWQETLSGMTNDQISIPRAPGELPVKDEVAHLWAWQQISFARAEAALHNTETNYPDWANEPGFDIDGDDGDVDQVNAIIYKANKDRPWSSIHADWKGQFSRYLDLLEQIPEDSLTQPGRYPWMGEYALMESLEGSYEHHDEHLEHVTKWLRQAGKTAS